VARRATATPSGTGVTPPMPSPSGGRWRRCSAHAEISSAACATYRSAVYSAAPLANQRRRYLLRLTRTGCSKGHGCYPSYVCNDLGPGVFCNSHGTPVGWDPVIVVKLLFPIAIRPVESVRLREAGRLTQLAFANIDSVSSQLRIIIELAPR
jgi:hypothetical protein